jgi:hypothetical protein
MRILAHLLIACSLATNAAQAEDRPPTYEEFISISGLEKHQRSVDDGKIAWEGRPQQEADAAALAGAMLARVPADIPDIIEFLATSPDLPISSMVAIDDSTPETLKASFATATLTMGDRTDIKYLLKPKPTEKFNYSAAEIEWLKEFAARYREGESAYTSDAEAATAALQQLLTGRFKEYREKGLLGAAPFQHSKSKTLNIAQQFEESLDKRSYMRAYVPDFRSALENYPDEHTTDYKNEFFLIRDTAMGRPLFILNHAMTNMQDDYALSVQQQFYVSNTLDMMTVTTLMLREETDTVVIMLVQASTHLLEGAARPVAAPVGRTVMTYTLKPIFKAMLAEFEE